MLEMVLMLTIVTGMFAIGDISGVATKARLSSVFVALMLLLVFFMTGVLPADIVTKSGLSEVARWGSPVLIFSMGTMIDVKQLIQEWRTVALSVISMLAVMVAVLLVSPLVGKEVAIVSIPVLNGGIISTQIMTAQALESGFHIAAAIGTLSYAVQKFIGTLPASYFGLKEANAIVEDFRANGSTLAKKSEDTQTKVSFAETHKSYFTPFVCFATAALGATIAVFLQTKLNIHNSILALVLGAIVGYLGLVPKNILEHGKSSGFITMAVFAAIIPSLAKIQFSDLISMGVALTIIFVASLVGIYVIIYLLPTWKLVGSRNLAIGIAMGQLLGFPATYLIANEVSRAIAKTDEEYEVIMAKMAPAYVVSGMATVTTLSIIIAGIMVKFI